MKVEVRTHWIYKASLINNIMKKLELKHVVPYLPYELELMPNQGIKTTMKSIDVLINMVNFGHGNALELNEFKLILRPLSDLTKEIEVNGEKFIPCIEYGYIRDFLEELSTLDYSYIKHVQYKVIVVLLELHFDVFGLIDKGLAIDINTI